MKIAIFDIKIKGFNYQEGDEKISLRLRFSTGMEEYLARAKVLQAHGGELSSHSFVLLQEFEREESLKAFINNIKDREGYRRHIYDELDCSKSTEKLYVGIGKADLIKVDDILKEFFFQPGVTAGPVRQWGELMLTSNLTPKEISSGENGYNPIPGKSLLKVQSVLKEEILEKLIFSYFKSHYLSEREEIMMKETFKYAREIQTLKLEIQLDEFPSSIPRPNELERELFREIFGRMKQDGYLMPLEGSGPTVKFIYCGICNFSFEMEVRIPGGYDYIKDMNFKHDK